MRSFNQFITEKLKITNSLKDGLVKSTLKDFLLWFSALTEVNTLFWQYIKGSKTFDNVLQNFFNNDKHNLIEFLQNHLEDIIYIEERKKTHSIHIVDYIFEIENIEFVVTAYSEDENDIFSKSDYILEN